MATYLSSSFLEFCMSIFMLLDGIKQLSFNMADVTVFIYIQIYLHFCFAERPGFRTARSWHDLDCRWLLPIKETLDFN